MKKTRTSFSRDLPPSKLYLEDIQAIVDALKEGQAGHVVIEVKGYQLENIDEIQKLEKHQLSELELEFEAKIQDVVQTIYVKFGRFPRVWSFKDSTWVRGVADKVFDIAYRRRRKSRIFWGNSNGPSVIFAIALGLFVVTLPSVFARNKAYVVYVVSSMLVGLALMVWAWRGRTGDATVIPRYRSGQAPFFERNKDQLVVGVITALIGAAVGAAVTWTVTGFWK